MTRALKRTLLVDADILAYQAAATNQDSYKWDDETVSTTTDLEGALRSADERLQVIVENLKATDVIICLTDRGNEFRRNVWPGYKQNRTGAKPILLHDVLDHYARNHKTYLRPGLEADDCMGILSTHPTLVRGEKIIVSEDKDMQTIPGLLFNPRHDEEPRRITKLQADRFFLKQAITGDQTDGYPGAPGVGPKSKEVEDVMAAKDITSMWRAVLEAFERAKARGKLADWPKPMDEQAAAAALSQARCARILRHSDWDFGVKSVRFWMPPRLK